MERVARSPAAALGQSPTMEGLGLTQEGLETNPVMTELLMANLWADEDGIDLNGWLPQYVRARYSGALPPQLNRAWAALRSSVYTDHAPDRPACCPTMMIVNRESKLCDRRRRLADQARIPVQGRWACATCQCVATAPARCPRISLPCRTVLRSLAVRVSATRTAWSRRGSSSSRRRRRSQVSPTVQIWSFGRRLSQSHVWSVLGSRAGEAAPVRK